MNRTSKWTWALGAVAALSIALNLLLIGGLFGEEAGKARHMERGLMTQMVGSVPPEVRPVLHQQLKERRGDMRGTFRDMRAARRGVADALGKTDFSDAALAEAFTHLRQQTDAAQALIHGAMVDTAKQIAPEHRQAWAESQLRRRRLPSEDMADEPPPRHPGPESIHGE